MVTLQREKSSLRSIKYVCSFQKALLSLYHSKCCMEGRCVLNFGILSLPPPHRWRHMMLTNWTSMAVCVFRLACSWWGQRPASRGRSPPSAGPSCCCTVMPTSSVTSEAPGWCTRKHWAQTKKSRWAEFEIYLKKIHVFLIWKGFCQWKQLVKWDQQHAKMYSYTSEEATGRIH